MTAPIFATRMASRQPAARPACMASTLVQWPKRLPTASRQAAALDAIEEIFNVKVAAVRTVHYEGKMKRRGRIEGRRASYKKAYVTLRKGEPMIDYAEAI